MYRKMQNESPTNITSIGGEREAMLADEIKRGRREVTANTSNHGEEKEKTRAKNSLLPHIVIIFHLSAGLEGGCVSGSKSRGPADTER